MNRKKEAKQLYSFFKSHTKNFKDSNFSQTIKVICSEGLDHSDLYGNPNRNGVFLRCKKIRQEFPNLHGFKIKEGNQFEILVEACLWNGLGLKYATPNKWLKNFQKELVNWNKLKEHINNMDEDYGFPVFKDNEISAIEFKFVKKDSIKISGFEPIIEILKAIKKMNLPVDLGIEEDDFTQNYMGWKQDMSKLVHIYLSHYSDLPFNPKYQTSDKICKVIYELFVETEILREDDLGESDIEDYIRILIRRSTIE